MAASHHGLRLPEQDLWQAVLHTLVADMLTTNKGRETALLREQARAWLGRYATRDFVLVCHLAGVDPQATHDRLTAAVLRQEAATKAADPPRSGPRLTGTPPEERRI